MKKIFLLAIVAMSAFVSATAQNWALVDMEYILKNIPAYESAMQQIEQSSKKWEKEISALNTEIQTLYKNYQSEMVLLSDEQKKERAQEILNHINNDNMDDEAFKRAYKLISSGQEEKGLEEIRTFIQKNPNVWNAWFLLGWGLRRIGRWADAEQAFNQSLSCGGENNCDTYNELAICLMEQGKTKEAKKSLQKALSINPENVKIISNLGYLSLKEGNIDDARKYFTIVLEYSPNDKIALSELAKLETEE